MFFTISFFNLKGIKNLFKWFVSEKKTSKFARLVIRISKVFEPLFSL